MPIFEANFKMLLESNANFPCSNLLSNNYFLKVSQKSQPGDAYKKNVYTVYTENIFEKYSSVYIFLIIKRKIK